MLQIFILYNKKESKYYLLDYLFIQYIYLHLIALRQHFYSLFSIEGATFKNRLVIADSYENT